MKTKALFVLSHPEFSSALRYVFRNEKDIEIVCECQTSEQGFLMFTHFNPDIVFLDLKLKLESGWDLIPRILAHDPNTKIIALSTTYQQRRADELLQIGAKGYIARTMEASKMIEIYKTVAEGGIAISTDEAASK